MWQKPPVLTEIFIIKILRLFENFSCINFTCCIIMLIRLNFPSSFISFSVIHHVFPNIIISILLSWKIFGCFKTSSRWTTVKNFEESFSDKKITEESPIGRIWILEPFLFVGRRTWEWVADNSYFLGLKWNLNYL